MFQGIHELHLVGDERRYQRCQQREQQPQQSEQQQQRQQQQPGKENNFDLLTGPEIMWREHPMLISPNKHSIEAFQFMTRLSGSKQGRIF